MHLRVVLTHTNFSDLGWRPYAWWVVNREGRLERVSIFTRNKKQKHVVVASQPAYTSFPTLLTSHDEAAARFAAMGQDRAWCYINLMASIERACGFSQPARTIYAPLDWLVASALTVSENETATETGRWLKGLLEISDGARVIGSGGILREAVRNEKPFVYSNPANLAILAALPSAEVLGGVKMASYWSEVERLIDLAAKRSGAPKPYLKRLQVSDEELETRTPPTPELSRQLHEAGVPFSQGMALSLHGQLTKVFDESATHV